MAPPPNDVELMLQVKAGSRRAFEQLVARHQRPIVNFFSRRLRDRDLAEDFAQEVFLRVHRAAPNYTPRAKFTTFLYRIANNYLIDHRRARAVRPNEYSLESSHATDDEPGTSLRDQLPGAEADPSDGLETRDLRHAILTALECLSDEQRQAFELIHFQGLKYADVAEVMGVPVGTIKSRMHAATHKLQEIPELRAFLFPDEAESEPAVEASAPPTRDPTPTPEPESAAP